MIFFLISVFGYQESIGRILETLLSTGLPDLASQCFQIDKYCHTPELSTACFFYILLVLKICLRTQTLEMFENML